MQGGGLGREIQWLRGNRLQPPQTAQRFPPSFWALLPLNPAGPIQRRWKITKRQRLFPVFPTGEMRPEYLLSVFNALVVDRLRVYISEYANYTLVYAPTKLDETLMR